LISLVADSPKKCVQNTTRRETGHHLVAAKGRAKQAKLRRPSQVQAVFVQVSGAVLVPEKK